MPPLTLLLAATPLAGATPESLPGEPEVAVVWSVEGEAGSTFGGAVSALGDRDGDGAAEGIAGATTASTDGVVTGATVVSSGATGVELHRWAGEPASQAGYHVAGAGDVDGDGVPDVISSGPAAGSGVVWVYSGATGAVLWRLEGEAAGEAFGAAVVGDVDGDGHADVAVGATGAGGMGRVILVSGELAARPRAPRACK